MSRRFMSIQVTSYLSCLSVLTKPVLCLPQKMMLQLISYMVRKDWSQLPPKNGEWNNCTSLKNDTFGAVFQCYELTLILVPRPSTFQFCNTCHHIFREEAIYRVITEGTKSNQKHPVFSFVTKEFFQKQVKCRKLHFYGGLI